MTKEQIEALALKAYPITIINWISGDINAHDRLIYTKALNKAAELLYSEEQMKQCFEASRTVYNYKGEWQQTFEDDYTSSKFGTFEEYIQSLKQQV